MKLIFAAISVLAIAIVFLTSPAQAANRSVVLDIGIADDRYDCAVVADFGERRACYTGGTLIYFVGAIVQLWEKDPGGLSDDYIGTWVLSVPGENVLTFAWEGAGYQESEANPQVYAVLQSQVQNTAGTGPVVSAIKDDLTAYPPWSWRMSDADDTFVANGCTTAGVNCTMYPAGIQVPTFSTSTNESLALMALDSAQHQLQVFSSILGAGHISMEFPRTNAGCTTGCALSRTQFGVPLNRGKDGDLVPHELGHIVQMRKFGLDTLRDDLNGSWSIDTVEYENGATTEGFASAVAAFSLWDQNVGMPNPANPRFSGFDMETGTPSNNASCVGNISIPGQTAKGFWDLSDANNEPATGVATGSDASNLALATVVGYWASFDPGTGNRGKEETGNDGVNCPALSRCKACGSI